MDRSTALSLWKDVLADSVKTEGPDLSARQAAILMRIYLEPGPTPCAGLPARSISANPPSAARSMR